MLQTGQGSNPQPPDHQLDKNPTEPPWPAYCSSDADLSDLYCCTYLQSQYYMYMYLYVHR